MSSTTRIEARHYVVSEWDSVTCHLCPERCAIAPNRSGACGVRTNRSGRMYLDTWGRIAGRGLVTPDTLPLYHYNPALRWLAVAMRGCNMRCPFCNTARFSQLGGVAQEAVAPDQLVALALQSGAQGISFGTNEPLVAHEYLLACFGEARAVGLRTHIATNAYIESGPWHEVLGLCDAVTVGLKGAGPELYDRTVGGHWDDVRHAVEIASASGVHLEITYTHLPGKSDREPELQSLSALGSGLATPAPLLVLDFEPAYAWAREPRATPAQIDTLMKRLPALWKGPVYGLHPGSLHLDTRCPSCRRTLVRRGESGYWVVPNDGRSCPACHQPLPFAGLGQG